MKKCNIYIGEIIKQVISEQKISKAELARRLGVKPQSVDYMLTRKSIDTDTLYLLSNILNYDFALLYSIKEKQIDCDNENKEINLIKAKVTIEFELNDEEIFKLNIKNKISDLYIKKTDIV